MNDHVTISTVIPILLPAYSVQCLRCEVWIEVRCECRAIPGEVLGLAREPATGHLSTCTASDVLPERCPRCTLRGWQRPRRYIQGQGTSRTALYRRRAKARPAKQVRNR